MHEFFTANKVDIRPLQEQLLGGVAELVSRPGAAEDTAAMAAGLSIALCNVNRFLVANNAGVSALTKDNTTLFRKDDDGVVSTHGWIEAQENQQSWSMVASYFASTGVQ
jgi:hypothetical protein